MLSFTIQLFNTQDLFFPRKPSDSTLADTEVEQILHGLIPVVLPVPVVAAEKSSLVKINPIYEEEKGTKDNVKLNPIFKEEPNKDIAKKHRILATKQALQDSEMNNNIKNIVSNTEAEINLEPKTETVLTKKLSEQNDNYLSSEEYSRHLKKVGNKSRYYFSIQECQNVNLTKSKRDVEHSGTVAADKWGENNKEDTIYEVLPSVKYVPQRM